MFSKIFITASLSCILIILLFGFSDIKLPSNSDASDIDIRKQNVYLEQTLNSPENTGDVSSLGIPSDTICYKGIIPAYPNGVWGHGSAILGDTLYVCGGVDEDGIATNLVYRYHIPYATWSPGRNMPFVKAGGDMVKCGDALYFIGGGTTVSSGNIVTLRYRPAFGWDTVARMIRFVSGNTVECWGDSVIYSIGGGWSSYYRVIQLYRPSANTWTILSDSLPEGLGRRTHASGLDGNKILVASGYSGFGRKDLVIGTLGPTAEDISWTQGPDMNCRNVMTRPGGVAIDGFFYVVAAETIPEPYQQDSIFVYNIATGMWSDKPISGRGNAAASNYWGSISAKLINNNPNIFVPGGSFTGATNLGMYVARSGPGCFDPEDTVLVILGDTTFGTTAQIQGRKADRDTLLKYVSQLTSSYDVVYKDTSVLTIPSNLPSYRTIIIHELATDATPVRFMSAGWRNAIKTWIAGGTPANKRTLVLIGGDIGYNYERVNSPVRDTMLSRVYGKFAWRVDNGNVTGQDKVNWLSGNYTDSLTTAPIGVNFWPDGCLVLPGGTALSQYVGRPANDTLAAIGHAPVGGGYIVASIFQDPRYYVGAGGTTGTPDNSNRGFKRILELTFKWIKTNGAIITGNGNPNISQVQSYELFQNYPNPFNAMTNIRYQLPFDSRITLKIYDLLGKEVQTIQNNDFMKAGSYYNQVNMNNLASGIYFYTLTAVGNKNERFVMTKKMLMIK